MASSSVAACGGRTARTLDVVDAKLAEDRQDAGCWHFGGETESDAGEALALACRRALSDISNTEAGLRRNGSKSAVISERHPQKRPLSTSRASSRASSAGFSVFEDIGSPSMLPFRDRVQQPPRCKRGVDSRRDGGAAVVDAAPEVRGCGGAAQTSCPLLGARTVGRPPSPAASMPTPSPSIPPLSSDHGAFPDIQAFATCGREGHADRWWPPPVVSLDGAQTSDDIVSDLLAGVTGVVAKLELDESMYRETSSTTDLLEKDVDMSRLEAESVLDPLQSQEVMHGHEENETCGNLYRGGRMLFAPISPTLGPLWGEDIDVGSCDSDSVK
eukprot:TRINITY_DN41883_c0_g1_i1.p1 TRINITY_DN41883_c0_g1~~TRINITY_DN41883_c0_g1_i1.p1  ORF type:complete len:329 (-),score=62.53 TRINITY_DN41883_c0_g1_i1:113-1099(-)